HPVSRRPVHHAVVPGADGHPGAAPDRPGPVRCGALCARGTGMNERKLETMEKSELAREYFFKGYNCAQSVALAFTEELGMSEETVARTVSGSGGGFVRMREMCGAVSGMVFVLSVLRGYGEPVSGDPKTACYAR